MKAFQKIVLSCLCGILFGSFAAVSFFVVREIGFTTGLLEESTGQQMADPQYLEESMIVQSELDSMKEEYQPMEQIIPVRYTVNTDVTEVVDEVMPAIVSITNHLTYNYYYYTKDADASGSGIIIDSNESELLVVTNYHVIEDNNEITVTFADGTDATAQVKGTDASRDLAVIAVKIEDLEQGTLETIAIAKMGDSDSLKVGEPVIAIGNALGYGQSVTTGVVSALDREMNMDNVSGTFIQTDAAINPGNSGGALLNINGEVIGINSNKIGGSAVEGMGYAIPISAAKPIIEELSLKETRELLPEEEQGYLGISGATTTAQEILYYGYPEGVYVAKVYEDTAAEKAGVQQGDFIISFDGETIKSMQSLANKLCYYEAGSTVEIEVMRQTARGYQRITLEVTLGSKLDMATE
ncbi:MAG: trypsin-like peptidase domain-containing protein [Lachnospiraceae bacterium]|nr:trypsin-like peptidase domain-containing protein [Lachnospiraceae bacterium]